MFEVAVYSTSLEVTHVTIKVFRLILGVIPTESVNWWGSCQTLSFELVGSAPISVKSGDSSSHYGRYAVFAPVAYDAIGSKPPLLC